jgi:hypothetical protein
MKVSELILELGKFRPSSNVEISDGKLIVEWMSGSPVKQGIGAADMGIGTASRWAEVPWGK